MNAPVPAVTKPPPVPVVDDLNVMAKKINECLSNIESSMQFCLIAAFSAGELLNKAKASVPHGGWAQWLEENCKLSEKTAQRYMKLANNRKQIESKSDTVSDLTFRQAERLITAQPAQPKSDDAEAEADKPPKQKRGNGPVTVETARTLVDEFVDALRSLRRNNHEDDAKAIANHLVECLKDVDLL
jgi:hypothetical protein